jgi:hypothetical protein
VTFEVNTIFSNSNSGEKEKEITQPVAHRRRKRTYMAISKCANTYSELGWGEKQS